MKKVLIDNKEYWQQEECDIPKISMPIDHDILIKYQPERLSEKDHTEQKLEMICDSPNTPTKGSEISRNDLSPERE